MSKAEAAVIDEEKRAQWQFQMTDEGWVWRVLRYDGIAASSSVFKTLRECTADALIHGYVVWLPEADRRQS